jgi:hypothetical protein
MDLSQIRPEMMKEYIGSEFRSVDTAGKRFSIWLVEVVEKSKNEPTIAFSLFFHGPLEQFLPQGIHTLQHEPLGEMEIFLVPVGRDASGFLYEAAFNLLR